MERVIETVVGCSSLLVPLLVVWAIVGLYTMRGGGECLATQLLYFFVLLFVAGLTVRTVAVNDACWLAHTSSLGVLVVAGALKKPRGVQERQATVAGHAAGV